MRIVAALVCICMGSAVSTAIAAPKVKLEVGFSPDHPGAQTTVSLGFSVQAQPPERVPPPITRTEILLPRGMGLGTTDLGEAVCPESILTNDGVGHCPSNSFMGLGQALVETALPGSEVIREHVQVAILMAPAEHEHTTVLFQVEGLTPVAAELVFHGELLDETRPYGATVVTSVPLVPAWADGPYVSLTHFHTTIGPQGLTYYKRLNGKRVSYRPRGMVVPPVCPRGGYPFAARLIFLGSPPAYVKGSVPCHRERHGARLGHRH